MARWLLAGCRFALPLLRHYEAVTFQVRDAESGASIPQCEIRVDYLFYMDLFHPRNASGMTDVNGMVNSESLKLETIICSLIFHLKLIWMNN